MTYSLFARRLVVSCFAMVTAFSATVVWAQARSAFDVARNEMVDEMIVGEGVKNKRVIEAMRNTPRHEFVPQNLRKFAYYDKALPIGEEQTISAPFIVAYMTEAIDPQPDDKVLEIGTGSGYQAAVLAKLVSEVYTIEIVEKLGHKAEQTLKRLRYNNVHVKVGDGYQGWPDNAPFDKIIVTCSPEKVPPELTAELREGGRMVIPVGERYQQTLYLLKKTNGKLVAEALQPTLFVPMTGEAEAGREKLPDPANPKIRNGGFESVSGEPPQPANWHYQRQLKIVTAQDAPEGDRYITFSNTQAGRPSQALQGFAVDGRKIVALQLSMQVRAKDVRSGQSAPPAPGKPQPAELPAAIITFFDENRAQLGEEGLGPWHGTFAWQSEHKEVKVPPKAREAVLCIGLLGGVGEISFDAIEMKGVKK